METNQIKSVLIEYWTKIKKFITVVLIFSFGYICSEVYHRIKNAEYSKCEETSIPKATKKISKISVAINERNELMIIDRSNGSYEIYQDSVGRCIFNLYANNIQNKYRNP